MIGTPATTTDPAVIEWVRSAAVPLATTGPRRGWADLEPLRRVIGDARIVSLGEATHGTQEFFTLKHRLIEFLVAELGFTTFVMEVGFPESLAVNAYVLHGIGTAADALTGMRFWVWDTEEVLDLIEWMRWWNLNNRRRVTFYGYSMTELAAAMQGLIDYLERVAPDIAECCKTELAPLSSDFTANLFCSLPVAHRDAMSGSIAQVVAAFAENRARWTEATGAVDWHLGRLHAVALDQGIQFAKLDRSFAFHEQAAAENVCALLEADGPDSKAVLWSHNCHAARGGSAETGKSMGMCLDDMVGRAQHIVNFSFDHGSFQSRTYPTGELEDCSVTAAEPGTFDGVLAQAGLPLLALDLANGPREGAAAAWLSSGTEMRSIGGIYGIPPDHPLKVTYTATITPREAFDAVIFVAETNPARRNRSVSPSLNVVPLPVVSNLRLSGEGIPTDWRRLGTTRAPPHAILVCDKPSPRGGPTIQISRVAPWRWGDGCLVQTISAETYQGHRMRFSAAVRTIATDVGSGALLYLEFLPKRRRDQSDLFGSSLTTVTSSPHPVRSEAWATCTVEADVPEEAGSFVIGLVMTGNGVAWFGDLDFTTIAGTS